MCGDSERTVTLTVKTSLAFGKLRICRPAGRTTACTPCHFHQLQLLCFPGLSWRLHGNPLHGETGKSLLSLFQATCCSRRGPNISHRSAGRASSASERPGNVTASATSFNTQLQRKRCFPFSLLRDFNNTGSGPKCGTKKGCKKTRLHQCN